MARGGGGAGEWRRAARYCSYKAATVAVCCVNLAAVLLVLRSVFAASGENGLVLTEEQMGRVRQSIRVRNMSVPVELVKVVKELREEEAAGGGQWEVPLPVRKKIADEILERLRGVKNVNNVTEQREVIQQWRVEKLEGVKMATLINSTSNSSIFAEEAKMLEIALDSGWQNISEDIGLWMPADVINYEISDKPENEQELEEEEIIPGQPLPPNCNAEPHTDYNGVAVKWGLTHHKDSAADCCQACLDHAKRTKPGGLKCNIWVYCPSESGCYSPDIYEHRHQECWLKQAQNPKLNFKHKYSPSYRSSHRNAPVVVPWISGVISS